MPVLHLDTSSGKVLIAFEQFISATSADAAARSCALGVRQYASIQDVISGHHDPKAQFRVPNSLARIEGTPSIERWNPLTRTAIIWFHYFNATTLRDEVARGTLSEFPGATPQWTASPYHAYVHQLTRLGVTGNIGGRHHLRLGMRGDRGTLIVQEGNIQPPPTWPTVWSAWRVWLFDNITHDFRQLKVKTHGGSQAIANPAAVLVPCPNASVGMPVGTCLVVLYFIFQEGAAKGEGGQLLYFLPVT